MSGVESIMGILYISYLKIELYMLRTITEKLHSGNEPVSLVPGPAGNWTGDLLHRKGELYQGATLLLTVGTYLYLYTVQLAHVLSKLPWCIFLH